MECPHIPELAYGDFSERLHAKVAAKRIPIGGSLELTFRCNLRCAHCYIDHEDTQKELTLAEIDSLLDTLIAEGCLWLLLTGGEPFVRKDFLDIYTAAKKKGMIVTLFTNGTMITEEIADYLADWRPFCVEITLYGMTKDTYENVTGVPGSHARCLSGIELLLERKIPLKLKTMVLSLNKHELEQMREYTEGLGLTFRYDPLVNPRIDGSHKPSEVAITPEEVVQLDVNDKKRFDSWMEMLEKYLGPPSDPTALFGCGAGRSSFNIDPYGKMSVCVLVRQPEHDLRTQPFKTGWYEAFPEVLATKRTKESPCAKCELAALCGQCPGWAELEHGDPELPVDYLCKVGHLRAEAFGVEDGHKPEKQKVSSDSVKGPGYDAGSVPGSAS